LQHSGWHPVAKGRVQPGSDSFPFPEKQDTFTTSLTAAVGVAETSNVPTIESAERT
jgi:hypothetical protein